MHTRHFYRACVATVVLIATTAVHAIDDNIAFSYATCKVLPAPFGPSITSGGHVVMGGDGCAWSLARPDGSTIEAEKAELVAQRFAKKEDMKVPSETLLRTYREFAATGAAMLEPLKVCDGGWQYTIALPSQTAHAGFYLCGTAFVIIETQGARSGAEFRHLADGMIPLLPELKMTAP